MTDEARDHCLRHVRRRCRSRGRFAIDLAEGIGESDHGRGIGCHAVACFEVTDPFAEYGLGLFEEVEQGEGDFLLLPQPEVERLFDGPGGFAHVLQADHATAAFECVEGAADCSQNFDVVRLVTQDFKVFFDRGQDFVGFLKEDAK